jgi:hypothetical protein
MVAKRDLGLFAWLYGPPLDCKTVPPELRARGLGQRRISKKKCYFRSLDHGIPAHSDLSLSVHGCVGFAEGLHQMGGSDLRHTARFGVDNS